VLRASLHRGAAGSPRLTLSLPPAPVFDDEEARARIER
jgi:hypothetical protein